MASALYACPERTIPIHHIHAIVLDSSASQQFSGNFSNPVPAKSYSFST